MNIQSPFNRPQIFSAPSVKPMNKSEMEASSRASASEELSKSVKPNDEKKKKEKKNDDLSAVNLKKRIASIEKIESLSNLTKSDDIVARLARQFSKNGESQEQLERFILSEADIEPMQMYLAMRQASLLAGDVIKANIDNVSDEYLKVNQTSIRTSVNIAQVVADNTDDSVLASTFRQMMGRANHLQSSTTEIYDNLTDEFENTDVDLFLGVYQQSLSGELTKTFPSANIDYITDTYSGVSRLNDIRSHVHLVSDTLSDINKIKPTGRDKHDLVKASFELTRDIEQRVIDQIASRFMGISDSSKSQFMNKMYGLMNKLPPSLWQQDEEKDKTLRSITQYVNIRSSNPQEMAARHRSLL